MGKTQLEQFHGTFGDCKILEVEEKAQKNQKVLMKVGGVFQAEDVKNKNGRIYPKSTWNAVFEDKEWTESLSSKGIMGELDHPKDGGQLRRVSHIVTKLERKPMDGKTYIYGEAEILDTPDGRILETLFRAGARTGISSRGEGSVEHDGQVEADMVKEDYRPDAFDFVSRPSTLGAFPKPLSESEQKEQSKVVLEALKELVESSDDRKVLLSCHRTMESYREDQESELVTSIVDLIESKLVGDEEIPTVIDNKHSVRHTDDKEDLEMDNPKVTKEAVEELTQMARDLAAQEIDQVKLNHENETQSFQQQITDLSSRLEDTTKKLDAAERIILAYEDKTQDLAGQANPEAEERLEAAKKLLKVALEQLEDLRDAKAYAEAAEKVAQALIDQKEDEKIEGFLDGALADVEDDERRESVRQLVGNVSSVTEAQNKLEALTALIGSDEITVSTKEPLPGMDSSLTEEIVESIKPTQKKSNSFTGKLWSRVNS